MAHPLHGQTCTVVLFEQPGGEIESLFLDEGVLEVGRGGAMMLRHEGGVVRIPTHLAEVIEEVTDEHRACVEELGSTYCLRAMYDGRLPEEGIHLDAILEACAGPAAGE